MSKKNRKLKVGKFRLKCQKDLSFLKDRNIYEPNNFEVLFDIVNDILYTFSSNNYDKETYNRVITHPQRLIYHANNILSLTATGIRDDKQKLNELKTVILFHDISKCINFEKYKGDRKTDHALFSSIIIETAMKYLEFEQDSINRISKNIKYHSDNKKGNPNNLDEVGLLLVDVDIIDEQDIYGLLLLVAVNGCKNNILKNNFMNQYEMDVYVNKFINDRNIDNRLHLPESIEYYISIENKIKMIKEIISFKNEEVFI